MYPVLAQELSEAHRKAITSLVTRIDFDAKSICVGQNENISCEFRWVCAAVGEATLGDWTVIDFECGGATREVLIFCFLVMDYVNADTEAMAGTGKIPPTSTSKPVHSPDTKSKSGSRNTFNSTPFSLELFRTIQVRRVN